MRKAKRTLLAAACACALVVGAVAGTVAYLTATTGTVTNTFTVGNVGFDGAIGDGIDEAKVDEYGQKLDKDGKVYTGAEGQTLADRVTANSYKLVPGHEYVKDPTVHMAADSEDAYLFVKVDNGLEQTTSDGGTTDIEAAAVAGGYQSIADQMTENGWVAVAGYDGVWCCCSENGTPAAVAGGANIPVFGEFKIADNADLSDYDGKTITVKAYAIQADGFSGKTAAQIWQAGGWTA